MKLNLVLISLLTVAALGADQDTPPLLIFTPAGATATGARTGGDMINTNMVNLMYGRLGITNPTFRGQSRIDNVVSTNISVVSNTVGSLTATSDVTVLSGGTFVGNGGGLNNLAAHYHTNTAGGGLITRSPGQLRVLAVGDSMTSYGGTPGPGNWFENMLLHTNFAGKVAAINLAKSGDALTTQLAAWHAYFDRYLPAAGETAVVLPWIGVNDTYGAHSLMTYSNMVSTNLIAYWNAFRTNGCQVAAMTIFNAGYLTDSGDPLIAAAAVAKSNAVNAVNVWIRALVGTTNYVDFVIDPDGYRWNGTTFGTSWGSGSQISADKLHPTVRWSTNMAVYVVAVLGSNSVPSASTVLGGLSVTGSSEFWSPSSENGHPVINAHGDVWMWPGSKLLFHSSEFGTADYFNSPQYAYLRCYVYGWPIWQANGYDGIFGINMTTGTAALHITQHQDYWDVTRFDTRTNGRAGSVSSNGTWYLGPSGTLVVTNDGTIGMGIPVGSFSAMTNPAAKVTVYDTALPMKVVREMTGDANTVLMLKSTRAGSSSASWGPLLSFYGQDSSTTNIAMGALGVINIPSPKMTFRLGSSLPHVAVLDDAGNWFPAGYVYPTNGAVILPRFQGITSNSFGPITLGTTNHMIVNTNGALYDFWCDGYSVSNKMITLTP